MKEYIKTMRECNESVNQSIQKFINALIEMVKAHGGFIELQDKSKSKIYGYALDDDDVLVEYDMLALRVVRDGDSRDFLECFLEPHHRSCKITYTKEDMLSEDYADQWYSLEGFDDALYSWATLVDMMETIEEYEEETEETK